MPSAPGMFCTTICGKPGRCLAIAAAMMRPAVSVPPPGGGPISMVMVLPSNETGACADTGAQSDSVAARATSARFIFRLPSIADALLLHHRADIVERRRRGFAEHRDQGLHVVAALRV